MKNNYSEKEIAIFNGVLKLARSGANITKITSRQIAAAAGMGKATIYDYFSSKEEIVLGALKYSMSMQAAEFAAAMESTLDFARKMNIIYGGIIDRLTDTGSIFHLLLQFSGGRDSCPVNSDICPPLHRQLMEFVQILYGVLQDGFRQGMLKTDVSQPESRSYVRMVFLSSLFAVASQAKDKSNTPSRQEIIKNAYTMLIKALG